MEAASDTAPIESPKRASMGSIIDSAENISTDLSSEEKGPDSTRAVGYTMGSAKVNVADITVVGSQEDCCPAEAYPGHDQREKKLISVVIGCGSREEVDLNVRGLVSEHASKEPDPETGHQWEKEQKMEIGSAQADEVGVLGHRSNGVLAVYYVHKFPVIQLLEACDQDIQPGLFLCMEDTMETVTWNDSLSGNSNSTLMDEGQFDAKFNFSKYFNQLQKDQELEEIPGEILDFCSDQGGVLVQKAIRRQRKNRRGSTVSTTRIVIPRLPSEEIRIIVYRSFQEILMHRLRETDDLNISEDAVLAVASDIEKELFVLFYCTNTRYKNKYRSLMFNLKDPRNTHLFRQVLLGEITPQCLVLMSPTELASLELMEWRKRENKHSIKLITAESDEFERQPMSKLTHKGEIEIERDTDQNLTLEDLMGSSSKSFGDAELSESEISSEVDTTHQHRSHLLDPNCQICMGNRSSNSQKRSLCLHVPLTDYDIGSLADPADSPRGLQWISEKDSLSSAPLVPAVKSGLRRSKESCMTSHLSNWAPDISANEIILFQSKHFSPMENTTGSPSPTKRPAASRRHHLFLVEKQIDSFCKERRIHIARFTLQRFHPQTQSVWKGFIQVSNMKRFLVKAYPVLGHTDLLTKVLSTTITVGRCVLPEAIWDSVDRLRSSGTKEICVVRFKPATRGDTCPYALYYSYLNSRQKYSAVILEQRSTKNVYLIPLPALQKVPSRLPPLSGPGLESFHPDLLLALAFTKKQHSTSAFKKPHECRRGPDRCLQENKSRQKCIEDVDKEHLPGQSQLSPFLAKPGVQPCILSMLPTKPFTQARELLHHSCQVKPSDLLLGDLLSSEELSSHTDLSNNFADEILKSFYCEEQQSDRIGNMFGSSAFTGEWENDGQNEDLAANEQHHGDGTGKENESRAGSERLNIETNLLTQFKPADVLPENFLLSVTELNSVLQQADESQKEGATHTNEQEADWTASTEYTEDMETYIKELDKLFTNVPLSSFSQHEDCSHLRSTISCCADVLNHLLSASENNLPCETQIPMCSQGSPNSITSSQEGPRHTTQTDSPLPLLTVQMSNNFQHLGPSGTMNFEPGVLLHALPANEVTVHPVEVPFQNVTQPLFPFRFSPSHCQRGIDAESHELPECLLSPYCPTQHHHCTNVHKDIGQGPTTSSGAPSSSSDGVL